MTALATLSLLPAAVTVIAFCTLAGTGTTETYEPRFTYHGFRYVEVTGYPGTAEQQLALARGEIDGLFTERASFRADPVASGLAVPLFQSFQIEPGLPTLDDIATQGGQEVRDLHPRIVPGVDHHQPCQRRQHGPCRPLVVGQ